jgi:GXGXG motif/Ammonium Transporter Family
MVGRRTAGFLLALMTASLIAAPALAAAPAPLVANKGDTAWMLVSTLLVLLMILPGLALFYGGLVRAKNLLSIFSQLIVVLGAVGRNFAAGMSGGIAYVWDPDQALDEQVNGAGVALEAVEDDDRLHLLVERHRDLTGSPRAAQILADWPRARRDFVQVMPHEYRRALAAMPVAAE